MVVVDVATRSQLDRLAWRETEELAHEHPGEAALRKDVDRKVEDRPAAEVWERPDPGRLLDPSPAIPRTYAFRRHSRSRPRFAPAFRAARSTSASAKPAPVARSLVVEGPRSPR